MSNLTDKEKQILDIIGESQGLYYIDFFVGKAVKYNQALNLIREDIANYLLSDNKRIRHLAYLVQNGVPEQEEYEELYPLTIIQDRYSGVYSGGKWTAFNLQYDEIPWQVGAGDIDDFDFDHEKYPYGVGDTPDLAYRDLQRKLKERK